MSSWPKIPTPGRELIPDGKFRLKDTPFQRSKFCIYTKSEINAAKTSKLPRLEWRAETGRGRSQVLGSFPQNRAELSGPAWVNQESEQCPEIL